MITDLLTAPSFPQPRTMTLPWPLEKLYGFHREMILKWWGKTTSILVYSRVKGNKDTSAKRASHACLCVLCHFFQEVKSRCYYNLLLISYVIFLTNTKKITQHPVICCPRLINTISLICRLCFMSWIHTYNNVIHYISTILKDNETCCFNQYPRIEWWENLPEISLSMSCKRLNVNVPFNILQSNHWNLLHWICIYIHILYASIFTLCIQTFSIYVHINIKSIMYNYVCIRI